MRIVIKNKPVIEVKQKKADREDIIRMASNIEIPDEQVFYKRRVGFN
jgi:hypothetical protein